MSEQEKETQSREDKFFGVKSTISDDADAPEVEVQTDDAPPKVQVESEAQSHDDDGDDELESYSEKVQKRIKKMTWEKNEERRQREAAESEREEAMRLAQNLLQKTRQQEHLINNGEGYVIEQVRRSAQAMMAQAQSKYRKAYEEGDTDAIIAAQDEMLNAKAELFSVGQREQDYKQRYQRWQQEQQNPQQHQPQVPKQPEVPPPTQRAAQWAEENPWFRDPKLKDMQALAFGIHERLIREEGVRPDTDEYFNTIDKEMHQRFPEYFGENETRRTTPVAPAQRNNGSKPRQVKLNQSQLALCKKLSISPQEYAREMMKDMYNG
jgi:hypothetical protein